MAQADAEDRDPPRLGRGPDQGPQALDRLVRALGISRAVRQEDAVGLMLQDGLGRHRARERPSPGSRCRPGGAGCSTSCRSRGRRRAAGGVRVLPVSPAGWRLDRSRADRSRNCWFRPGLPGERLPRHHLAGQVAADQAGALPRLLHQAGVVEIGGREDALHRPLDPGQPHQGAGVDALEADDAVSGQEVFERPLRAEVADPAAQLANRRSRGPRAGGSPRPPSLTP